MRRSLRLRKGAEFDRVFREGAVHGSPFFVFRSVENDLGDPRWGVAAGKKTFRLATDRNRVRRRLKAAIDQLECVPGRDIVVLARPAAMDAPIEKLRDALAKQIRRVSKRESA